MSDNDGVSRRESVRDQRHCPMSHALHDDSYGPQLYIPAGCSSGDSSGGMVYNSYDGSDQKQL